MQLETTKGGSQMCKHENCERHEYDYGLCLPHLKEKYSLSTYEKADAPVEETKPKRTRKKKVDAVEVVTNDETEMETRDTE